MNRQTSRQVGVAAWNPTPNETPRNGDIWYDKATGRFAFREQGATKYLADGSDGVPTTRRVTAGEGLTGGGTLAADISLAVAFGASAGTACAGNDPRLFNARVPTLHASTHRPTGLDPVDVYLSELQDVELATPADGQSLVFNGPDSLWKNQDRFRPISGVYKSPTGVYEVALSYDPGTKKVTFTPTGVSWRAWVLGNQFNFGTVESTAHSASPGIYFVYVDAAGTITTSSTFFNLRNSAPLAIIKWNGTTGYMQHELHNAYRNPDEHLQNHLARGTFTANGGLVLGDYTLATATDAANSWSLSGGTVYDEDISHTITAQADGSNYNRAYWNGTTWAFSVANLPFYDAGGGTPWIQYNNFGAGTLVSLSNNQRVNYWVCVIPFSDTSKQIWVLPGQVVHSSLAAAQAEAFDYSDYAWLLDAEGVALYKITYIAEAGNANTGKCKIESVQALSQARGGVTVTGGATAVAYTSVLGVPTDTVLGRQSATTGAAEAITCTAAGRALLGDADAAAQKATLGLALLATTGITGVLTLSKSGTTARTATFPDAAITVAGSASALTSSYVPYAGASGILADSVIRQASSKIGIGMDPTGSETLQVSGAIRSIAGQTTGPSSYLANIGAIGGTGATARFIGNSYAETTVFIGQRASGTQASPAAVGDGELLAMFVGSAHDGVAYFNGNAGVYGVRSDGVWSATNHGTKLTLEGIPNGSLSRSIWMTLQNAKVGIGRTPTTYALEVAGDVLAYRSGTADNVIFIAQNGDRKWHFGIRGDTSDSFAIVDETAGAFRLQIDSAGKVGINSGKLNITSIPTSSSGLSSGDVWSDGGTLKIVA